MTTVKGITKQVVWVRPREDPVFEQAIFFLRDNARNVTEQELLRQAGEAVQPQERPLRLRWLAASFFAGAGTAGLAWLLTVLL